MDGRGVGVSSEYQCPIDSCESGFGSRGSVKAHITRMTDSAHKGESGPDYSDEIGTGSVSDSGTDTDTDTDSGSGVVPPEYIHDTSDSEGDSGECCSSPVLQGSAGDVFELESGEYVRLEEGDEICVNCDTIHE